MFRASMFALVGGLAVLAAGSNGQEPKKEDSPKLKGFLPQNWAKIGLTDDQKQQIYKVQAKHGTEIEKLEAEIRKHKADRDAELKTILTADQKKKLEEILTGKSK